MESNPITTLTGTELAELRARILAWGEEEGFQQVGIAGIDLAEQEGHVRAWLDRGFHGSMDWLDRHFDERLDPAALLPGTCRVISARMNYLPDGDAPLDVLADDTRAYVSRYALGRDYHKVLRRRLARLAQRISEAVKDVDHRYRAFTDSAPVLEKALGANAGLGWMGRHSLLIHPQAGSFFFLGEVYTNLPLPVDVDPIADGCGACRACVKVCPTGAIVADRVIDARRCISYLTIEHDGAIDPELRGLMGNRVFGCDDCQLYCPWNRTAPRTRERDFRPRHGLEAADLVALFEWTEAEFLARTEGSAIRRISYAMWRRNLAIALGNGPVREDAIGALVRALPDAGPMVAEHIEWALGRLTSPASRLTSAHRFASAASRPDPVAAGTTGRDRT